MAAVPMKKAEKNRATYREQSLQVVHGLTLGANELVDAHHVRLLLAKLDVVRE